MQELVSLPRPQSAPSLTEQTYEIILQAILSLELRPGDRLSVQRLGEQLGVSRTPVKDAFLRLEQEGLVSIIPQKGTFVSDITVKDAAEILESRVVVEGYAAGHAAQHLSSEELVQAEAILVRMKQAFTEGHLAESAEIGNEFHRLLLNKLNNSRLTGFIQQLDIQYTRIRHYLAELTSRHSESIDEHFDILVALKTGDADQASAAMRRHLSLVRDDILSILISQPRGESLFARERKED